MKDYPIPIEWVIEDTPLGTGGGIRLALSRVTAPQCVILNGDTFFDVDLMQLYDAHVIGKKAITLALKPMRNFDRYGTVNMEPITGTILCFNEKQYCEEGLINGGVYVISKNAQIFEGLGSKFSFETAVLESQCAKKQLLGVVQDGYFIDIGIPLDYQRSQIEFKLF
jgi:D-glycero-alpha-D-manno-heptose 1-phosphate guanylyltransferase